MDTYQSLVRPLLFRLSADRAHGLAKVALRFPPPFRLLGQHGPDDPRLSTDLAGLQLTNPIGLAPGFEKDGRMLRSLDRLGFGFLVAGSITEQGLPGNPRPRLARYPDRLSLANAMGLPNDGAEATARGLAAHPTKRAPILVSVAGSSAAAIANAAATVEPVAAALEIGLVCPNSSDTERMAELAMLDALLARLLPPVAKPVFLKLPPHRTDDERKQAFRMVEMCVQSGVAGVSLSGGRTVPEPRIAVGRGSLSGRETFADAHRIVSEIADEAGGRLVIRAAGGVWTGDDALAMLRAGARTVEIYTAFIYQGWRAAIGIKRRLVELLDEAGASSLAELVGG